VNRQNRRQLDREFKRNKETIEKLTPSQTKIVDLVANEKARIIADDYITKFGAILDRNFSAAMLENGFKLELVDIILTLTSELTIEDMEKANNLEKEGNVEMATKKVESEVREEIGRLLDLGEAKQEIINKLVFKFPKLSKSMLVNAYAKVVEEKESSDPDVNEAMEKIADILSEDNKEVDKVIKQVDEIKVEENSIVELKDTEEKEIKDTRSKGLKIKTLNVEVEGINGSYTITDEKIHLKNNGAGLKFFSKDEWKEFAKEIDDIFNLQEDYKTKVS